MTRRTGYTTRGAVSTLTIGDPDMGTKAWGTEYDVEFTDSQTQEEEREQKAAMLAARASLRTPRSLKKGYVLGEDYEALNEQYGNAVSAYRDLQLQLGSLEQRLNSMRGSEQAFLSAVEEQHGLIDKLRQQVAGLTDSLGRLLGGVERNRSLMAVMDSVQDSPTAQVATGQRLVQGMEMTRRLSSLEAKVGEVADAVASLARSQAALASRTLEGLGQQRDQQGGGDTHQLRGISGRGRTSERIERLPSPVLQVQKQSFWKP